VNFGNISESNMNDEHRKNNEQIIIKLATMEERQKNTDISVNEKLDILLEHNIDIAKRLATLELWKESVMGKITVIAIVIGAGWTIIVKKFF
jgi:hypothetical protein